jgi:GTPase SAR1 family protein
MVEAESMSDANNKGLDRQKIVFVGDVAVGKTSIINRFMDNPFKDNHEVCII